MRAAWWEPVAASAKLVPVKRFLLAPVTKRAALEYLYAAVSGPLAIAGFVYVFVTLSVSGFLSITLVGLPLLALALLGARLLGGIQRGLALGLLGVEIAAPPPPRRRKGWLAQLGAALSDMPAWRGMAYQLIRTPLAGCYALTLTFGLMIGGMSFTYPIWWLLLDPTNVDQAGVTRHSAMNFNNFYIDTLPRSLMVSAAGALILLLTPWVLRAFLYLDGLLMHGLLGPTRSELRILDLTESRAHAVDDSAAALRRIERDLHDGAQAQLVALAMQLGEAKENLDDPRGEVDLVETRALIDNAHRNAKQAINELRDLARGIHPPALDNGLEDALGTLASRSTLPVTVGVFLHERPSAAVETLAYFCTAELLTNATKHSLATRAEVVVEQDEHLLRLRVTDNGLGGARVAAGGGLAGLVDRVGTVDGTLEVDSPTAGPTVVTIELPLHS